ncbi:TetR family transcriptional regulator [Vibrio sp. CAIM 722]|uniref:TetR family transcriptional regulator n=1 Tax=Vibrio eleionomae TaxID=2653505 RepID=A0A7X4LJH6_9VIBR|nr:TetR/AcrR family transcriptional regulator [Vibrio eleionomae]MZI93074.1 TetR family transcriptional regulator [Vibrio eleionomae]
MMQKRAIERAKLIVDSAIELLKERGADDISLADIAAISNVPLPSIYNFFPNKNMLFIEVARQFHIQFIEHVKSAPLPDTLTWQNLYISKLMSGFKFQNDNPAMMRLFLGSGVSSGVKNMDIEGSENIAHLIANELLETFNFIGINDFQNKIAISFALGDGILGLSYSKHGKITNDYMTESIRASISYLRLYMPEFLDVRN